VLWSEWVESIRKDVECFFGVLKARFQFLRNPIEYNIFTIDDVFKTCCILHNMLLAYDGLDGHDMMREDFWNALDPNLNDTDTLLNDDATPEAALQGPALQGPAAFHNVIDMYNLATCRTWLTQGPNMFTLKPRQVREKLILHFKHQYRIADLWWPKGFGRKQRLLHDIPRVTKRTATLLARALYTKVSNFKDAQGASIGEGLFSKIAMSKGDHIAWYTGELVTQKQYDEIIVTPTRTEGYAIRICPDEILDCFNFHRTCKAFKCNDFHNIMHVRTGGAGFANVDIVVSRGRVGLFAIKGIPANTEMLADYKGLFL